jgi:hypothetical protein
MLSFPPAPSPSHPLHSVLGSPKIARRLDYMTAVPEYSDLHRLVDRLTPPQARALRAVALELVRDEPEQVAEEPASEAVVRRLSFAGAGHGPSDLAATSRETLRRELGGSSS